MVGIAENITFSAKPNYEKVWTPFGTSVFCGRNFGPLATMMKNLRSNCTKIFFLEFIEPNCDKKIGCILSLPLDILVESGRGF
jgi:hypothetical protein